MTTVRGDLEAAELERNRLRAEITSESLRKRVLAYRPFTPEDHEAWLVDVRNRKNGGPV